MKTLILMLLTVAGYCHADVILYRATQTCRAVGGSQDIRLTRLGVVALNPDTGEASALFTFSQNGLKYFVAEAHSLRVVQSYGRNGAPWTALQELRQGTNPSSQFWVMAYGKNAALQISATRVLAAPKTLTAKPQQLIINAGGAATVWDTSLTFSFNSKGTLSANAALKSPTDVTAELRATYLGKGYIEVQSSL